MRSGLLNVLTLTLALWLLAPCPVPAGDPGAIPLARFSQGDLAGWEPKVFSGRTQYRIVEEDGRRCLQARADASGSGLIKEVDVDLKGHPLVRFAWRIQATVPGGDVRRKAGDDAAARVMFVFPGTMFWQTKAVTYLWANRTPPGQGLANPFTANSMMLALRSGDELAGRWVSEERNLLEDYRRLFGEDPPRLGAVAVMTDTDQTGARATAWYGDITLLPAGSN